MADRADVPSHPWVTIQIDHDGRITVNGHEVPNDDGADPLQFATDVVRTDFAVALGRPVRAIATFDDEQVRMVIRPDGTVTDVERDRPATPAGVPPATRTHGRAVRDAASVAAEVAAARHAGRRHRYPVALAGAGAIAAAAALVVVWSQRGPATEEPAPHAARTKVAAAEVAPGQPLIESTMIRPVAVSAVGAEAGPEVLRLSIVAQGRTPARVVVKPLGSSEPPHRLSLSIRRATTRVVTLPSVAPGRYRWQVRVPGQPAYSGVIRVPAVPPPADNDAPADADDAAEPAPDDTGTRGGGAPPTDDAASDPPRPTGVSDGPDEPVDPDDH